MGTIIFITPAQERIAVSIKPGTSVMEAAVANDIQGIEAQCYGAGVCGTCHVYVPEPACSRLDPPSAWEQEMLEPLPLARVNSRLSCQLRFSETLDGSIFEVPA